MLHRMVELRVFEKAGKETVIKVFAEKSYFSNQKVRKRVDRSFSGIAIFSVTFRGKFAPSMVDRYISNKSIMTL